MRYAIMVLLIAGCSTTEAKYTKALLNCVDAAKTLAESRECRRHVDGDYGITQTTTDGGTR